MQGFASALVQGIDFRIQDIEYKFSLLRQDFAREVKYAALLLRPFLLLSQVRLTDLGIGAKESSD